MIPAKAVPERQAADTVAGAMTGGVLKVIQDPIISEEISVLLQGSAYQIVVVHEMA